MEDAADQSMVSNGMVSNAACRMQCALFEQAGEAFDLGAEFGEFAG